MRRSFLPLAVATALLTAAPLAAQQQPRTISPGMTMEQVRAAFGAPAVIREADGWTYFFYTNRCLPRCGTDDTVFFRDGQVVTAVLHSPARRFDGPRAAAALGAVSALPPREPGAAVTGIRVTAPEPREAPPVDLGVIRGREFAPVPAPTEDVEVVVETVDTIFVAPGPDQDRQLRERRLEPTTVRTEQPTPAEPVDPIDRRSREERMEANTIRRRP
jgi:hypothetical protein